MTLGLGFSEADLQVAALRHQELVKAGRRAQALARTELSDRFVRRLGPLHRQASAAHRAGASGRERGARMAGATGLIAWTLMAWRGLTRRLAVIDMLLMLCLGAMPAPGRAQEATPAVNDPALVAWVTAYNEAWSSGDPSQVTALYAEDAHFEELILGGITTQSHDELDAYAGAAFDAFSDFAITVHAAFVAGDQIAIEWVLTGRYTGQFGDLPPGSGQIVEVPGASIITIADGLITEQREYWDVATLLSQVGALPGPAS